MVVGERNDHNGADDDLPVDDDGLLLDGVHTEHSGLREVDDGGAVERAEDAAVGAMGRGKGVGKGKEGRRKGRGLHGEGATGHVFKGELAVTGLRT